MRIIEVTYSALANLGNYENERISMTAILEDGESPEEAVEKLRESVTPLCGNERHRCKQAVYHFAPLARFAARFRSTAPFGRCAFRTQQAAGN